MKKLLLVLLVVTLASFLLVGCNITDPGTEDEGDEGEDVVSICPTVSVTSQVEVDGKTYIKGGKNQTITVTFAVPTEPVAVYVGLELKETYNPFTTPGVEVVMYPNDDKTIYTGTTSFGYYEGTCGEAYIYVDTCLECDYCKYPYIVDNGKPFIGQVERCVEECTCDGCILTFTSKKTADLCDDCADKVYCGDCCSGFASWSVQIYDDDPFSDDCCDTPCAEPIDEGTGECQVDWETACLVQPILGGDRTVYALVTAYDMVGNKLKQLATVTVNPDTCNEIEVIGILPGAAYDCVDTPNIVGCLDD